MSLASLFDSLELLQIGLIVVSGSGGDMCVQNNTAVGIDALMHFVFELSWVFLVFWAKVASGSVRLVCVLIEICRADEPSFNEHDPRCWRLCLLVVPRR